MEHDRYTFQQDGEGDSETFLIKNDYLVIAEVKGIQTNTPKKTEYEYKKNYWKTRKKEVPRENSIVIVTTKSAM